MNHQRDEGFRLIHDIFRLKWIPEIIQTVGHDSQNYSDISRKIGEISNTELNRKLALLIDRQVIEKREGTYILSKFGKDLDHIFNHFLEMSQKYLHK
ncbi:MAG: HxlR family transcriptional regulator [Alkaliphilus sp.]|nr:winged helix-turn-helix transcriptional regulator [bacterium AH-315-G05]PHS35155.1 MAG: HxlR family transcriptional regulator [Alkaliphilus sp.]